MKVPLDWFNGTHPNASVSIAIAKLPAQVPVNHPDYAGPVLINPGGPGGSGIALALLEARQLQTIVDPSGKEGKFYDILGFDPRGIGFTEPHARCMPDDPSAWSWQLRESTEGILGSSDAALGRLWSMTHAFGSACKQHSDANGGPDIKYYMSTASVARDMLEIAEKHAEWAVEESIRITPPRPTFSRLPGHQMDAFEKKLFYTRGEVKLTYLGFSYGTYLGSTFAAMFPDRVGRLVLDGVVNAHDYNNGLAQGSLHDTERDMQSFYTFCFMSGPTICPITTPDSTFEDIEQRTQRIIKSLYHNPIALNTDSGPEIFTYSDLKGIIFSGLYTPTLVFPFLGQLLAAVETRHGPLLEAIASALHTVHVYTCSGSNNGTNTFTYGVAQDAILCGDGGSLADSDIDSMDQYFHLLEDISPTAGGIWAMLRMRCSAWPFRPLTSWGRDSLFHGNTSHPILFLSATADPVTPLQSARTMSSKYTDSVVLIQDTAGHCTLFRPTACTISAVKTYFQTGELPPRGTVCVPPTSPWSLNSTDPESRFYDPSLGQAVWVEGVGLEREMEAARGLEEWAAGNLGFGRGNLGGRVERMMEAVVGFGGEGERGLKDEL